MLSENSKIGILIACSIMYSILSAGFGILIASTQSFDSQLAFFLTIVWGIAITASSCLILGIVKFNYRTDFKYEDFRTMAIVWVLISGVFLIAGTIAFENTFPPNVYVLQAVVYVATGFGSLLVGLQIVLEKMFKNS